MLEPSKRTFASRGTTTTEAALLTRGFSQLYVSLGDQQADGALAVRIYHKPLVLLIWFGPVLMAFGGALSLTRPAPARRRAAPAKQRVALQPAE